MVQIVPQQNVGGNIGEGFSSGLGQGLDFLLKSKLQEMKDQKANIPYNISQAQGKLKGYVSADELGAIGPEGYQNIIERSQQYANLGPDEALRRAYFDFSGRTQPEGEQPGQPGQSISPQTPTHESIFQQQARPAGNLMDILTEEYVPPTTPPRENIAQLLSQAQQEGPKSYQQLINTLTAPELLSLPQDQQFEITKQNLPQISEEANRAIARGVIPFGLYSGLEKEAEEKAGLEPIQFASESGQELAKSLGEFIPMSGIFKLAGMIPNILGRGATAAGLFASDTGLRKIVEEGRAPTVAELAISSATGGLGEVGPALISKAFQAMKKIPGVFKNVPKIAKATKVADEVIEKKIAENVLAKGVTPELVAQKNPRAWSIVKDESNKVAKVFNNAEKANIKQMEKIRKEVSDKLPESPLGEYYKPKKEVTSRPATILKEEMRLKPLNEQISKQKDKLRSLNAEVIETENYIRANQNKLSPAEMERAAAKYSMDALEHRKVIDNIKKLEFEKKYKRPPITSSEIKSQIDKSFEELTKAIENPSLEKLSKVRKQLEKDKGVIKTGEKLLKRGEIPGKDVMDEYIKINEAYNKAYGNLEKELKDFIRRRKPLKTAKAKEQAKNAEELLKTVQQMKKTNEARVAIQKDKRKAMGVLNKPSGAFYRQTLKDMGKNLHGFEKDYFKWNKIASEPQKRTTQVAKKALEKPKKPSRFLKTEREIKEAAAIVKNPSIKNIESAAIKAGESPAQVKQTVESAKKQENSFRSLGEALRGERATDKTINQTTKSVWDSYKSLTGKYKPIADGVLLGLLQSTSEELAGKKLSANQIRAIGGLSTLATQRGEKPITGAALGRSALSTITANVVHSLISSIVEDAETRKLKSRKGNLKEYNDYASDIRNRYSKSRADKIIKESRS